MERKGGALGADVMGGRMSRIRALEFKNQGIWRRTEAGMSRVRL